MWAGRGVEDDAGSLRCLMLHWLGDTDAYVVSAGAVWQSSTYSWELVMFLPSANWHTNRSYCDTVKPHTVHYYDSRTCVSLSLCISGANTLGLFSSADLVCVKNLTALNCTTWRWTALIIAVNISTLVPRKGSDQRGRCQRIIQESLMLQQGYDPSPASH